MVIFLSCMGFQRVHQFSSTQCHAPVIGTGFTIKLFLGIGKPISKMVRMFQIQSGYFSIQISINTFSNIQCGV